MSYKAIYFDMDGTLANLYKVSGWLDDLQAEQVRPYIEAEVMVNMSLLARLLNRLQKQGYKIGIVSWLSKNGTKEYGQATKEAKIKWLQKHLKSIVFDEIYIIEYGTPKQKVVDFPNGILFDDEEQNRNNWTGQAFDEKNIIQVLKELL